MTGSDDAYRSCCKQHDNGVVLFIRASPRASRSGPLGGIVLDDQQYLKWGIHAAPEDGKANNELIKTIAKYFKLPKSDIEILSGENSRIKRLLLHHMTREEVLDMLSLFLTA